MGDKYGLKSSEAISLLKLITEILAAVVCVLMIVIPATTELVALNRIIDLLALVGVFTILRD